MDTKDINKFLGRVTLYREVKDKLLSLNFGVYNNTLRLYVRETDKERKESPKLICNLSLQPEKARYLKEMLLNIKDLDMKDKDNREVEVKLYGIEWDKNNKPIPNSKVYLGSLAVGKIKNKEGSIVNYLAVVNRYNKKFIFPFLPTPYEEYYIDGSKIDNKTILSNIKLNSFRATLENILNFIPEVVPELEEIKNNIKNKRNGYKNDYSNKQQNKKETVSEEISLDDTAKTTEVTVDEGKDDINDLF